jgi:hypothetical protein
VGKPVRHIEPHVLGNLPHISSIYAVIYRQQGIVFRKDAPKRLAVDVEKFAFMTDNPLVQTKTVQLCEI